MSDFIPIPNGPPARRGNNNYRRGGGGRYNNNNNNNSRGGFGNRYQQHRRGGGGGGGGGRGFRGGRGGFRGGGGGGRGFRGGGGRGGRGRGGGGRNNAAFGSPHEIFEEIGAPTGTTVGIAIEGCCHGELDKIYRRIQTYEEKSGRKIDLLICCGDFQSLRTYVDFHNFAAPPKYRALGSFVQYYSGAVQAPVLTLFVGGNHENSQQLQELYYGGWVAPNIYYMGAAGVVNYKGIRIGGISGIYNSRHYHMGHFERPPYNDSSLRSVYHVRSLEVYRLKCLAKERRLDVMISHDWPQGVERHGNTRYLINKKPFFEREIQTNSLGSPANYEILQALRPKLWFSAHLHVGFRALVRHGGENDNQKAVTTTATVTDLVPSQAVNSKASPTKEVTSGDSSDVKNSQQENKDASIGESNQAPPEQEEATKIFCQPVTPKDHQIIDETTKFVSLDKCLPGRQYLSVTFIEPPSAIENHKAVLEYDLEWLAILRKTHGLTEASNRRQILPEELTEVSAEDIDWVLEKLKARIGASSTNDGEEKEETSMLSVPNNFSTTVPAAREGTQPSTLPGPLKIMGNPQTDQLLEILELQHVLTVPYDPSCIKDIEEYLNVDGMTGMQDGPKDDNEIDIDDEDVDDSDQVHLLKKDDNEIEIEDDDGGEDTMNNKEAVDGSNEIAIDEVVDDDDKESDSSAKATKRSEAKKPRIK